MAHKALVTGASRGIGAAIAAALQAAGVEVLAPTRAELDLANPPMVHRYLGCWRDCGVDILVNNAGINVIDRLDDVKEHDWEQIMQINLTAPRQLMQGLLPGMRAAGWGRIVNISSIFGQISREKRGSYSASKAGLLGLTRAAAVENARFGVLINAVCPGYVETELTKANNTEAELAALAATVPQGRLGQPEDIARLVAFLCSEDNTYMTGQALFIDGGLTCI